MLWLKKTYVNFKKLVNHRHITGKYRGCAHEKCNLNPIYQEFGKYNFKINVTPKTAEKYVSFIIEKTKNNTINPKFPLAFIHNVHF